VKLAPTFDAGALLEQPATQWITNGGTLFNQRYSPLAQINARNVHSLKSVWRVDLRSGADSKYSGEAQPLVYGGTVYVVTGADDVFAIDVATGRTLWKYSAHLTSRITTVCCGWTSRGVALGGGKVFVGRLDGKLVALDQRTGKELWSTQVAEWQQGYTLTSAPLYYGGLVISGLSGGEYGIRGRVTAFDAKTGREVWRFYTVPGPGQPGHDTWPTTTDAWQHGGAPVWQTPAVDPGLGLLYFSTGNAAPDFDGSTRAGDNLFSSSIVAIDARTGTYRWHFQEVHHDLWDYDAPSPVVLFDLRIDGHMRHAIAEAGKTGWVYILDRSTGRPLLGIPERPVPQLEQQRTSLTQPYPVGDAFVPQRIEASAGGPALVNQGRIFTPYWSKATPIKPGANGGTNWPPSSYSPLTRYLYVCASDRAQYYRRGSDPSYSPGQGYTGSVFTFPASKPAGTFTALDMTSNRVVWQHRLADECYSGSVATGGGLVFVGMNDGRFVAYDARSGALRWSFQTGAGANAPASVFSYKRREYVVLLSAGSALQTGAHGANLWLFALGGKGGQASAGKTTTSGGHGGGATASGKSVFEDNCSVCHGVDGQGGNGGPSLQGVTDVAHVLRQVRNGGGGMPAFGGRLSDAEIRAVAGYVTQRLARR
jgi:quinohemoprotein ethanol dehydrogenase